MLYATVYKKTLLCPATEDTVVIKPVEVTPIKTTQFTKSTDYPIIFHGLARNPEMTIVSPSMIKAKLPYIGGSSSVRETWHLCHIDQRPSYNKEGTPDKRDEGEE